MAKLLFGTAGVPHSASRRSSIAGIRRVRELGLGCMEVEFVQRVSMGPESARETGSVAEAEGVRLTAHASYYINLNSLEPEKRRASRERLLKAARIGRIAGAEGIVFHPGFYMGMEAEIAYRNIRGQLERVLRTLREEGNPIPLRPETGGKLGQFGSLEEILRLCGEVEGLEPCIDFSHLHARSLGELNTREGFRVVLERIVGTLGKSALKNLHMHISGIEYGRRGERRHLTFQESKMDHLELLTALRELNVGGLVVCESPNLEEDALLLKETYHGL